MTKKEFIELTNLSFYDGVNEVVNFCNENGLSDYVSDVISKDRVTSFVKKRFESGGEWTGVACCISDIVNNQNEDFYHVDGYENLELLDSNWVDDTISDILAGGNDSVFEEEDYE